MYFLWILKGHLSFGISLFTGHIFFFKIYFFIKKKIAARLNHTAILMGRLGLWLCRAVALATQLGRPYEVNWIFDLVSVRTWLLSHLRNCHGGPTPSPCGLPRHPWLLSGATHTVCCILFLGKLKRKKKKAERVWTMTCVSFPPCYKEDFSFHLWLWFLSRSLARHCCRAEVQRSGSLLSATGDFTSGPALPLPSKMSPLAFSLVAFLVFASLASTSGEPSLGRFHFLQT